MERAALSALDVELLADPLLRRRVELILADQQHVLAALADGVPEVAALLADLRALPDRSACACRRSVTLVRPPPRRPATGVHR